MATPHPGSTPETPCCREEKTGFFNVTVPDVGTPGERDFISSMLLCPLVHWILRLGCFQQSLSAHGLHLAGDGAEAMRVTSRVRG